MALDFHRIVVLWTSVVAGVVVSCGVGAAAPHVVLPTGKEIKGTSVKANERGEIFLSTAKGVLTFPKGTTVVVDEPPDYARAIQMMQQREYDKAIETLNKIIKEYRFLQWDKKAKALLAGVYLSKKDYQNAVKTYDEVLGESPGILDDEDVRIRYLRAVLGSGKHDKLNLLLDETIARSSRNTAAVAQIMRGDLNVAAGNTENALYDFLRTAELFKDVPDLQAEANYKTGECLEKLGNPRAAEFYSRVAREFPDSPFAARALRRK